jgi:hypothetical protein
MAVCPNGNTIYCTTEHPCEGCERVAAALADLRRVVRPEHDALAGATAMGLAVGFLAWRRGRAGWTKIHLTRAGKTLCGTTPAARAATHTLVSLGQHGTYELEDYCRPCFTRYSKEEAL